ncbi:MAG: FAD binding domain-containing protein [Spirochaetaceae bacterium]
MSADRTFYAPESLGEIGQLLKRRSDLIYAGGGTYLMDRVENGDGRLGTLHEKEAPIVSLHRVEELQKIARSERFAEIGSAAVVQRVLGVGRKFLPSMLIAALRHAGPFLIRNTATIGGNIAIPTHMFGFQLALQLLDARVEVRGPKNSDWLAAARLRDSEGRLTLEPGSLITRIRIPLESYTAQEYQQFGDGYGAGEPPLCFTALASVSKESLERVHLGYLFNARSLLRLRDAEAQLVGAKLPLTRKLLDGFVEALSAELDTVERLTRLQQTRAVNLTREFLSGLDAL